MQPDMHVRVSLYSHQSLGVHQSCADSERLLLDLSIVQKLLRELVRGRLKPEENIYKDLVATDIAKVILSIQREFPGMYTDAELESKIKRQMKNDRYRTNLKEHRPAEAKRRRREAKERQRKLRQVRGRLIFCAFALQACSYVTWRNMLETT